jgi:hypothetical protein
LLDKTKLLWYNVIIRSARSKKMSELTMDISKLKIGCKFIWGKVLKIIEIED